VAELELELFGEVEGCVIVCWEVGGCIDTHLMHYDDSTGKAADSGLEILSALY
jgi:hypothetical protein